MADIFLVLFLYFYHQLKSMKTKLSIFFLLFSLFSFGQVPHCGFDFTSYLVVKAHEEGKPLNDVLDVFNEAINRNKVLIAHNIKFDNNVVACEM